MTNLMIYPGDNGAQEFFEAPDGSWLVMRDHGTTVWNVYRSGPRITDLAEKRSATGGPEFVLGASSREGAVRKVRSKSGVRLHIGEFLRFENHGGECMELVEVAA